ncbi:MAG TPA: O-antigen ligase family protein, partial [Anaerolineae bacterium]
TLVPLLDGNPADDFAPPADPAIFSGWAGEFARRYGDRIDCYVIWDEPNLASHWGNQPVNPIEYAALLTAAAKAIRAADADALIVAAPLAPTVETGPLNLADPLYLQALYDAGAAAAFDVAAGKPYGFDRAPDDRMVDLDVLNFSRAILLHEVMLQNDDGHKALWAGNWGWNSLPAGWKGASSIWGQVDEQRRAAWTVAAFDRARREWPWMGAMFLENWEPAVPAGDAYWGFSIAGRPTAEAVAYLTQVDERVAFPGFHLARASDPAQVYSGGWRFSPEFGADISESGDSVTFTFWGTDVGLRVRRADFRARLIISIDGGPANALPKDEQGSALVLTAADPSEETIATEWVARNLPPGEHTMTVVASRGWDQWALNGFSVAYHPPDVGYSLGTTGLALATVLAILLALHSAHRAEWGTTGRALAATYDRLSQPWQLALTAVMGGLVALTGWLTWGEQVAGVYRRLGDSTQLALTAAAASIFYVTPLFVIYGLALAVLFTLIYFRPAWGLALIAFSFPFYVQPVTKPIFQYRFSPAEIFTLVTVAAFVLSRITRYVATSDRRWTTGGVSKNHPPSFVFHPSSFILHPADYAVLIFTAVATLSLLFTERLDVATNEWRVVIFEPALFYLVLRGARLRPREMWVVLDAFIAGGVVVALYGLYQFGFDRASLITAEGGLMRIPSIYGSPNNLALYLGRILPLLVAMALLGNRRNGWRRWVYTALLAPTGVATMLTFSKGALFLGLPAALLFVFWRWQRANGRRTWPWLTGVSLLAVVGLLLVQQVPALAGRLSLLGETGVFRVNLWRATLNMFADHPLFGVGLDNFLYAYRGRYILEAAWQEPNLNHPHNFVLDFATRLGFLGLLAGGWMAWVWGRTLWRAQERVSSVWLPIAVGLGGAFIDIWVHGLVDQAFFLIDLAFAFYLLLGTTVWLDLKGPAEPDPNRPVVARARHVALDTRGP